MDDCLIENWNQHVHAGDRVYFLGDFAFGNSLHAKEIMKSLNGNIYFIKGNHDRLNKLKAYEDLCVWMCNLHRIKINDFNFETHKQHIVLCHYAMRIWDRRHYGAYHCYGHSHGTLPEDPYSLSADVGIDAVASRLAQENETEMLPEYYRPITYEEFKRWMQTRTWQTIDHH